MAEPTEISFVETPDGNEANRPQTTEVRIDVGIEDETRDYRAEADVRLYVDGERVEEKRSDGHLQDESFIRELTHTFDEQGTYRIRAFVGIDWYIPGDSGVQRQDDPNFFNEDAEVSRTITIAPQTFTASSPGAGRSRATTPESRQASGYQDAFEGRTPVVLDSIEPDEDVGVTVPQTIEFTPNDNPDITVDTSGRFAKHEIIGGVTVRQKIGEDPVDIGVSGVCDEETAQQIDQLRNAKQANLISDRISMTVQVGSTSTSPMEEGGAADMKTGDLLYTYSLSLIGIEEI